MKNLYFMRHGQSIMNRQGIFSGHSDTPLSPEGIRQCQLAGRKLRETAIDVIVSSPLKRALESAKIVATEINYPDDQILVNSLFVERNFGPMEGTTYTRTIDLDRIEGVEHSTLIIQRAKESLEFLNSLNATTILVVAHGSIGRALQYIINPSIDYRQISSFNNAEVIRFI